MSDRGEALRRIQDAAYGCSLNLLTAPTQEQIRAMGEAAAAQLATLPEVLTATYDYARIVVNVTLTGETLDFPVVLTVDEGESK